GCSVRAAPAPLVCASKRRLSDTPAPMHGTWLQRCSSEADVALARGAPGALLTIIVVVAGATLTWLAWRATVNAEEQRARGELALEATEIEAAIEDRLLAYEGLLRSGAGIV